ncbi:glycoside hydrolase family 44 protein [Ktedonospora formicarum]|uniref:Glycoside hydrolase family 44 catalytic domain-containing protein n=1 Tax=Ktedonospora formicarum TaxID=2778364 RepID=A0A8J3I0C7_9CHLR|nr:glycoside hydrolase family 44 protein [Ktedonospora formicarum]GHO42549.1 hypothetical protein KSX_07120 [Ktedonospora formicarum]
MQSDENARRYPSSQSGECQHLQGARPSGPGYQAVPAAPTIQPIPSHTGLDPLPEILAPGSRPPLRGKKSGRTRRQGRGILVFLLSAMLLISLVLGTSSISHANTHLLVSIGDAQQTNVDLNLGQPISPYLYGSNVFPKAGSDSQDAQGSGFMSYDSAIVQGLRSAQIRLLRFPGGEWGEQHTLSTAQLDDFSHLLHDTGADGLIQAPLSDPQHADTLSSRASRAGLLVDYMNNAHSIQRKNTTTTLYPIKYWVVGNEPDRLTNPDTGATYTAIEYAQAFIQYSIAMHQNDPNIKVFGPEISQFYGAGLGPRDSTNKLWMETFLQVVSTYEKTHPTAGFHLLDGVSFHRYPFNDARQATSLLLDSTGEWDDLVSSLRQIVRQDFQRDLPVAITEVNTNPNNAVPPPDYAALWWADTLGRLMDQQVEYMAFFSTEGVDTPYPLFTSRGNQATLMLRTMQLFTHLQKTYVPTSNQQDNVSLYVTQDQAHNTVSLLFINKGETTQIAHIRPDGLSLPTHNWNSQDVTLKGRSLLLLTLKRGGANEAYTLLTSQGNLETSNGKTPVITRTVCGQESTATDTRPC